MIKDDLYYAVKLVTSAVKNAWKTLKINIAII